jgi:hypothetical protein
VVSRGRLGHVIVSWLSRAACVTCYACSSFSCVPRLAHNSTTTTTTDRLSSPGHHRPDVSGSRHGEQAAFPRSFSPQSSHISYASLPSFQIFPAQARRLTHTHPSRQPCRTSLARRVQHGSIDTTSFPEHRRFGRRKVSHQSSSRRLCPTWDQPPIRACQPTVPRS